MTTGGAGTAVAWVSGVPVPVAAVDDREAALRRGRATTVLPAPGSGEGRQLRRWLVQVLVGERLVRDAAAAHGVTARDAPPLSAIAPDGAALLELGSVVASLLTGDALARAVFASVTRDVTVPEPDVVRFYTDNPELFTRPECRVVRHGYRPDGPPAAPTDLADSPLRVLRRGELTGAVEDAVFAARAGDVVGPVRDPSGWHTLRVLDCRRAGRAPLGEVRAGIERRLLGAARRRAFTTWLDRRCAAAVRLAPGYEHPGDPRQPDNTHRH